MYHIYNFKRELHKSIIIIKNIKINYTEKKFDVNVCFQNYVIF